MTVSEHDDVVNNVVNIFGGATVDAERRSKFDLDPEDPDRAKALSRGPFAASAPLWFNAGWAVLLLPEREKDPPPPGYTGGTGKVADYDTAVTWIVKGYATEKFSVKGGVGNIAIRMPTNVIGIDVDAYKEEGEASFKQLEEECGALPDTWFSTSRNDGMSGIRFYRVPDGVKFRGAPMPGIEIIQHHHRYAIVGPSIHPDTGERYVLWSPQATVVTFDPPTVNELPMLPNVWIERLQERPHIEVSIEVHEREQIPLPPEGNYRWCRAVDAAYRESVWLLGAGYSRHDIATATAVEMQRLYERGFPGALEALEEFGTEFRNRVMSPAPNKMVRTPNAAEREWRDIVASGMSLVAATSPQIERYVDPAERMQELIRYIDEFNADAARQAALNAAVPVVDVADVTTQVENGALTATDIPPAAPVVDRNADIKAELALNESLAQEFDKQRVRARASEIIKIIEARKTEPKPFFDGYLHTFVDIEPQWIINEFLPKQARLLFVAHRKTGKTSIALHTALHMVNGGSFLGRYDVANPLDENENVGFLNFELAQATFNRWVRQVGVPEDRIYINHLRGIPNPFATERDFDRLVARLVEHNVKVLIVDPVARAFVGENINDTTQMTNWTNQVDRLAEVAGISELILTNHAGWEKERGRNSTVLEDWADVIVTIVADRNGTRFLKAEGRDVEIEPALEIEYSIERRTFLLTDRTRAEAAKEDKTSPEEAIVNVITCALLDEPAGLSKSALERICRGVAHGKSDETPSGPHEDILSWQRGDGLKFGQDKFATLLGGDASSFEQLGTNKRTSAWTIKKDDNTLKSVRSRIETLRAQLDREQLIATGEIPTDEFEVGEPPTLAF